MKLSILITTAAATAITLGASGQVFATMGGGDNMHRDETTGFCTTTSGVRYGQAKGRGFNGTNHAGNNRVMWFNMTEEVWFYDNVNKKWNMKVSVHSSTFFPAPPSPCRTCTRST